MDDNFLSDSTSQKLAFGFLIGLIIFLLVFATFFYHFVEGWSYVDSFYFASTALTTRGFSNLAPTTTTSKLFTSFYLFLGVVLTLYCLSVLIGYFIQYEQPKIKRRINAVYSALTPDRPRSGWFILRPKKKN
jgi:uncharacterized membrane protein